VRLAPKAVTAKTVFFSSFFRDKQRHSAAAVLRPWEWAWAGVGIGERGRGGGAGEGGEWGGVPVPSRLTEAGSAWSLAFSPSLGVALRCLPPTGACQQPRNQHAPSCTKFGDGTFWPVWELYWGLYWELYWELYWREGAAGGELFFGEVARRKEITDALKREQTHLNFRAQSSSQTN
jgi:hypothetical protein